MKTRKRWILVAIGAVALTAIAWGAPKSAKDTLVLANRDDVGTLAPYQDTSTQGSRVRMQVFEPLFMLKNDGSFEPVLAKTWEWKDPTHFVLHLREGVKFHNGKPFTADDVLFSLQYAKKGKIANKYALLDLASCKAVDALTVELVYTKPDGLAMTYLGGTAGLILDKETSEANPDSLPTTPIGTGPYKFVRWVTGDSVTLVRNDAYWGPNKAIIKNLIFRNVAEITQRTIELQTGGVDFVFDLAASAESTIRNDKKFAIFTEPSLLINSLYPNVSPGKPLANEDLRKAVACAINAADIVKGAYDGNGKPPAGVVSRAAPGFNPSLAGKNFWPFNLDKAKEYFAKSGVAKGTTLEVIIDGNAFRIATSEIIKNQLAKIGLNLNIRQYDFGTALSLAMNPAEKWDIYMLGSGEASAVAQLSWFTGGIKFVTYPNSDPGFKAMVEKLMSTTDVAQQKTQSYAIQEYIDAHVPIIPVQEDRVLYAHSAKLKGVGTSVIGGMVLMCKDLYFE